MIGINKNMILPSLTSFIGWLAMEQFSQTIFHVGLPRGHPCINIQNKQTKHACYCNIKTVRLKSFLIRRSMLAKYPLTSCGKAKPQLGLVEDQCEPKVM